MKRNWEIQTRWHHWLVAITVMATGKKKNLNTTITAISVSAGIIFKNPFYNYDWENTNLQHKFLSYFFFHFVLIKSRCTIHIINPLSVLFLIHQLVLSTPASISFACDVYFNLLFQTYLRNFLFDCNCDDLELSIASMIALNSTPLLCICFILFFSNSLLLTCHVLLQKVLLFGLPLSNLHPLVYSVQTSYMDKCNAYASH